MIKPGDLVKGIEETKWSEHLVSPQYWMWEGSFSYEGFLL